MPFTGSHPAAVLPFFRVLVGSALVIGSMVPDLPYYVPSPVSGRVTHTTAGAAFDLVAGLVAVIWWTAAVAPVARAIAPVGVRARLAAPKPLRAYFTAAQGILVIASVAVGVATHIVWDEFTHGGRWGARHIDWLATSHAGLGGYEWVQYASGVVGMSVILLTAARWWVTTPPSQSTTATLPYARRLWLGVALATILGMVGGFTIATASGKPLHPALFDAARGGGGAAMLTVLVVTTVVSSRRRAQRAD